MNNRQQYIEQLQQAVTTLQEALQKEQQQTQPKPLEMWKPELHAPYYFGYADGEITDRVACVGSVAISGTHAIGNCFPTREIAEYYAARRAARQRLEMLALAENGMVPYEAVPRTCHWTIVNDLDVIGPTDRRCTMTAEPRFPTKAAAQRVLDAMTDEDLILLYGTANRGGK